MPHSAKYDYGDKTYREHRAGDGERIPPKGQRSGYNVYEKNETVVEDNVLKPGPVLSKAMTGNFKKGKRPKGVMSASGVAEALAKAWHP
jgi:hypothetical protein